MLEYFYFMLPNTFTATHFRGKSCTLYFHCVYLTAIVTMSKVSKYISVEESNYYKGITKITHPKSK